MTNKDVIATLSTLVDLLMLQGADAFRIRSYQRAVNTLRGLTQDINSVEPTSLPGIGKGLAATINELLTTGKCELESQLRAEIPAGLITMLEIQDLGPKTAKRLYDELGIADIDALETAAKEQQLRGLKGFGAKTEENLLANIALWRRGHERRLAYSVLPYAEQLLEVVTAVPGVSRAGIAGSLRRGRDTAKDIDILTVAADSAPVMSAFCSAACVDEVVLSGDTKSTVRLTTGVTADLRVVPAECSGAALQYFTGSKQHNIALRSLARDQGLSISEYGVKRLADDVVVASADEAEVYAALGLAWIDPALREDHGEIAAAAHGELPKLIETADLKGDLHCHTTWSDGAASVLEMAQAAQALGYDYLAITDHSQSLTIANGLNEERVRAQADEIAAAQDKVASLRILRGIEVDILADGRLDLDLDLLNELDVVVASVHSAFNQSREQMTERLLKAVASGVVDVLGHPTGRILTRREGYEFDFERVVGACTEHGVALEINASPSRLDLDDAAARWAQRLGAKLAIDSDAHAVDQLPFVSWGVKQARRGWLSAGDVMNAQPRAH